MQEQYLNNLKELDYATLTKDQESKLKTLESQFNTEFGKDVYFMVLQK